MHERKYQTLTLLLKFFVWEMKFKDKTVNFVIMGCSAAQPYFSSCYDAIPILVMIIAIAATDNNIYCMVTL